MFMFFHVFLAAGLCLLRPAAGVHLAASPPRPEVVSVEISGQRGEASQVAPLLGRRPEVLRLRGGHQTLEEAIEENALAEEAPLETADPREALSKLLAEPLLAQDLQEPPLRKAIGQGAGAEAREHSEEGKGLGESGGRANATLRHGAYRGNSGFGSALRNVRDESEIRPKDLLEDLRDVFHVNFPLTRGTHQNPKAVDLTVHVSMSVVLLLVILGTWLGCFLDVPLLAPGFWLLAVLGVAFAGLALCREDGWMLISALSLTALAAMSATTVGNDPLLMNAFSAEVGDLRQANRMLHRNNEALQGRLDELSRVQDELLRVSEHFNRDLIAAQNFLREMEKMVVLQIVTDIMTLYFTTLPKGAGVFAHSLVIVPDLVPGFEMDQLVQSVKLHGLSIAELATLLDAVVAEDPAACSKALEALCRRSVDKSRTYYRDEAMASAMKSKASTEDAQVAVVPLFSYGGIRIFNVMHLVVVLATVLSVLLLTIALVRLDGPGAASALLELGLAGGLLLHAELLATVQALRAEVAALRRENARFERANNKLGEEAAFLGRLGRGFDRLQAEFAGSVERAREAVRLRNASVKTSTIAVVAHLFARADADHNGVLEEDEAEAFVRSLGIVFGSLPDFNPEEIRRKITIEGLSPEDLGPLVNLILGAEHARSFTSSFRPRALGSGQ